MTQLTPTETAIYEIMVQSPAVAEWTCDDILKQLYGHLKKRERPSRHAVMFQMRMLVHKTAYSSMRVVRTTPLGRGHVARFSLLTSKVKKGGLHFAAAE